jgi:hypothetical protein
MAQPTGSTPTISTFGAAHTKRGPDTLAVVQQQYNGGTGDGTLDYGADAMTPVADFPNAPASRYAELATRASPASGAQSITASGTGTPRGQIIRTYDNTTGALLNIVPNADESTTVSVTKAAPNANNLGQLFVYINGADVTISGESGCSVVTKVADSSHVGVLLDVFGANPSFTISAAQPWIAFAFDVEGTAAALNLFLGDNAVAGQNFGELELAAPTAATSPTGWTVAGLAAGQMARLAYGVERAAGVFSATAQPSGAPDAALGDGFRTAATLNGSYAAATWTIQVPMLAVDAAGANLRARIRLWRSANADMSGATEITSGAVIGTTITALGTVTPQISTCTVALGTVTLTNEYLFLQIAAEVV